MAEPRITGHLLRIIAGYRTATYWFDQEPDISTTLPPYCATRDTQAAGKLPKRPGAPFASTCSRKTASGAVDVAWRPIEDAPRMSYS